MIKKMTQSRIHLSRLCLRHRGLQKHQHQQERERASALQKILGHFLDHVDSHFCFSLGAPRHHSLIVIERRGNRLFIPPRGNRPRLR